jgi:4-hydroxy-tetrahydrodipicolinate reductase
MKNPACVVVGLGHHGALLARQIADRGYALVGAVEVNDLVGKDLPTIISGAAEGSVVHPAPAAALAAKPEIAVIAVTVPLDVLVSISREFLAAGVNVVTINPEFFDTAQDWKAELDAVGRQTGATLLATGVQDTWWVQMPAVAAGASSEVTRITVEH